jgi:hypothetical protein
MSVVDLWRDALDLDGLEAQHGLPPGLMTEVLRQESAGHPSVENVRSGATGLFQFMPDTARAYKIDPTDPFQAAPAAAKELGTLYDKYDGDVSKTLAAWNWGQGRLDRFGLDKAPQETKGFIARITSALSPASAEAAERPAAKASEPALTIDQLADQWLTKFPAPQAGHEPSAQSTPQPDTATPQEAAQAVALRRQVYGELPEGAQGYPTTPAQPGEESTLSYDPATGNYRARILIEKGTNDGRTRFAPPQDTGAPAQGVGSQQAAAPPQVGIPGFEGLEFAPTSSAQQEVPGEGLKNIPGPMKMAAATAINAVPLVPALAAGAVGGPWAAAATESVLNPLAHEANIALGLEERGAPWFSIKGHPVDTGTLLGVAAPWALPAGQQLLRNWRAGQALTAAERETAEAGAQYAGKVATARDMATEEGRQAWEAWQVQAQQAHEAYLGRVRKAQQVAEEANAKLQTAYASKQQSAIQEALAANRRAQADYQSALTSYTTNVAAQEKAVLGARAIPGRYLPETPSSVLYDKLRNIAGEAQVTSQPAKVLAQEMRHQVEEYGAKASPEVLTLLRKIEDLPETTDVATMHELLKQLGPLSSKGDGTTRGIAQQLMSGVHDSLEHSASLLPHTAEATDLLYAARGAFRREKAVEELARLVTPGAKTSAIRVSNGRLQLVPDALENNLEGLIQRNRFFAGSFTPDELAQLRQDVAAWRGLKKVPGQAPSAPDTIPVRDVGPAPTPAQPEAVAPPQYPNVPAEVFPKDVGPPPIAVNPQDRLAPLTLKGVLKGGGSLGGLGFLLHQLGIDPGPVITGGALAAGLTYDVLSQGLAKALLTPTGRKILGAAMQADGTLDPGIYPVLRALGAGDNKTAAAAR